MIPDTLNDSRLTDDFQHAGGNHNTREPLAIIGIGCRFPGGSRDATQFWNLIATGTSAITEVPADRWNADRFYHPNPLAMERMVTKWGGFVDQLKHFDAAFWGVSPREAMRMDPQQRWLLEVAWEALEDAGVPPALLRGSSTGVFVGISANDYHSLQLSDKKQIDVHSNSGGTLSIAANRVSYLLDLRGPSVAVDTACSSALVAVSLACQAIWSGTCDSALAGGANALISPNSSIGFSKAGMLSPSGQCFAFDERANGYVRGEGAGLVYLKPLSRAQQDGDRIYAVVRAAVVNQDGHTSSMTVPGVKSQMEMLRQAYHQAGFSPHQVDYVEAHGTGTPVGDPIESEALGNVLGKGRPSSRKCLIGSVKTNIGHLESGSGIAGMIKSALVLHHRMIPPNQNFKTPNPGIPFEELGLEVVKEMQPLACPTDRLPVVGVNSFGFGGTNAHVVLEAAPLSIYNTPASGPQRNAVRPLVLPISARDGNALRAYAAAYHRLLSERSSGGVRSGAISAAGKANGTTSGFDQNVSVHPADICYSAGRHKEQHAENLVVIADDVWQLLDRLQTWLEEEQIPTGVVRGVKRDTPQELVFVFTGQGSQWWGMGQQLLQREPVFRQTVEKIDALFQQFSGWSIVHEMQKSETESRIDQTAIAQPAICALQIALVELWKSWGVVPTRVVGHSVGEVAAAYCAGALTLEDTVKVIYHRSRLQDTTAGHGRMLAAGITPREARQLIGEHGDRVHITAINSPELVTLGGDTEPLERIAVQLEHDNRFMRWLKVNYAFHTHQMEPIREPLLASLASIRPQAATIPFVSTVTGNVCPGEKLDAMYWWHNVRRPVLFAPAITQSIQAGATTFIEVGAHPSMQSSLTACLAAQNVTGHVFHSLSRKTDESLHLLSNLAQLHLCSVKIDWAAVNQTTGQFVKLPSYPWQYEAYWLDRGEMASRLLPVTHPFLFKRLPTARPTWQFETDLHLLNWLTDHRLWDGVVFPAAGFAEIGLAIARELFPGEPYAVEELEMLKALFVPADAALSVQIMFDHQDSTFRVFSLTSDQQEWELHASGRLVLISADMPVMDDADLNSLLSRQGETLTHEEYYTELSALGYQFGPEFSQINHVWRTPGESLVEIIVPDALQTEAAGYRIHPAVLDACFQATHGARNGGTDHAEKVVPDYFFLPESVRRIQLYNREIPGRLWAHARLRAYDETSMLCDIFAYDEKGQRVADIMGFRAAKVEHQRDSENGAVGLYQFHWEESAGTYSATAATRTAGQLHLVFADTAGVADRLIDSLLANGDSVIQVRPGTTLRRINNTEFVIPTDSPEGIQHVLELAASGDVTLASVIHCWSLDHAVASELDVASLRFAQQTGTLSALYLAQMLAALDWTTTPKVTIVTCGAQAAAPADSVNGLASSPIVGFLRVANNELPQFHWTHVDLDEIQTPDGVVMAAASVLQEIERPGDEREIAFRGRSRLVNRMRSISDTDLQVRSHLSAGTGRRSVPFRLQTSKPGILTRLSLNETHRTEPQPDEIEVRILAGGINFRDLMKAMGMYPGNPVDLLWFGDDFSGVVERVGCNVTDLAPGDRVAGIAPYCFRSFVTIHRRMVFRLPEAMSFTDAATLPTAFLTAHYALHELARMQPGESVLIHAGTGGVGQAAIQVAQALGLKIFATAGSVAKRQMLTDMGVPYTFNSRTLEFADEIMAATQGRGVDAVLNSLAREFIPKSLSVLAPFGRFIEIGKIDVYGRTAVRLNALKDNISYFVIDLAQHLSAKPDYVASMLNELSGKFASNQYRPLPSKVFPITEVVDAFRYMAQGKHIGKNVLSFDVDQVSVSPCNEEGRLLKADATYLITGGAGGFGWEIAKWMVSEGARSLALLSRSGPGAEVAAEIEQLRSSGVAVLDVRADVTCPLAVKDAIRQIDQELPPLRGIIHAAMILDDLFIHDLNQQSFNRVLHPKVIGGWNLHASTLHLPLDYFVCFSSVSSMIGTTKQSNYSAANFFLDALAAYRQASGLPSLTVNWGAIGGAGYFERNQKARDYIDKVGFRSLSVPDALKMLRELMQRSSSQVAVARADWEQLARFSPALGSSPTYTPLTSEKSSSRTGGAIVTRIRNASASDQATILEDFLTEQIARVFGIEASQVDRSTALTHLGLDSLMAVELMNRLEHELNLTIPLGSVLSGPNVQQLASTLLPLVLTSSNSDHSTAEADAENATTSRTVELSQSRLAEFWTSELENVPVGLNWPLSAPDSAQLRASCQDMRFKVAEELALRLSGLSAELDVRLTDILFATFQLTLHQLCDQSDLLVGYGLNPHETSELHDAEVLFRNMMPLRSRLESGITFVEFLDATVSRLQAARRHLELPFSQLMSLFELTDDSAETPFPKAGFSNGILTPDDPGRSCISLVIDENGDGISGTWRYRPDQPSPVTVAQIDSIYNDLLVKMVSSPNHEIDQPHVAVTQSLRHAHDEDPTASRRLPLLRPVSSVLPDEFASDLVLSAEITPVGGRPIVNPLKARRILLTGSTGFLGAFLLDNLLQTTHAEIVCLVRAADEAAAKRRVMNNLKRYSLASAGAAERIHVIVGDFSKPNLGLCADTYHQLSIDIDVIYHNGADVNLALPYASLRATNVGGVVEILKFAVASRTKAVHLVSTFTVHTTPDNRGMVVTESDPLPPFTKLLYGYSQTKWVGEKLAQEARRRGIPVTIYRPGHITGDSRTGISNTSDLLHTIVLMCLQLGAAPLRDVELDVTPVDYVAQAIVQLSMQQESENSDFLLTNPIPMSTSKLMDWLSQSYPGLEFLPYEDWRARLLRFGEESGIDNLRMLTDVMGTRAMGADDTPAVHPRFDSRRTQAVLRDANVTCPSPQTELFDAYLSYLRRMEFLTPAVLESQSDDGLTAAAVNHSSFNGSVSLRNGLK
ncbi:MAG: thioester reductase domain-containing protein [Planctomycetaceae bacterium]|nr:thioester reductase domain-containing protein [Planctomycetaceae bacterium]